MEPNFTILGSDAYWWANKRPCVYAWIREGEYLYIGSARNWSKRLAQHWTIREIMPSDQFLIWNFDSRQEAYDFEREMILKHLPKLSRIAPRSKNDKVSRQADWQVRMIQKGKCSICGKRKLATTRLCRICADKNKELALKRYYAKA